MIARPRPAPLAPSLERAPWDAPWLLSWRDELLERGRVVCPECEGDCRVEIATGGCPWSTRIEACPRCEGAGELREVACWECGEVMAPEWGRVAERHEWGDVFLCAVCAQERTRAVEGR